MDKKTINQQQNKLIEKNLLAIFPTMQQERAKKFTTLTLTLFLLCVFGLFAIAPTLSTIAELKRKIKDSTYVSQSLDTKIQNLNTLHSVYAQIADQLPFVFAAIPQDPKSSFLVGQLQQLAQTTNVNLESTQVEQVDLTKKTSITSSFIFILTADGTKDQLDGFVTTLSSFERLITIDTLTYTQVDSSGTNYIMNLRGKAYFKQ